MVVLSAVEPEELEGSFIPHSEQNHDLSGGQRSRSELLL